MTQFRDSIPTGYSYTFSNAFFLHYVAAFLIFGFRNAYISRIVADNHIGNFVNPSCSFPPLRCPDGIYAILAQLRLALQVGETLSLALTKHI